MKIRLLFLPVLILGFSLHAQTINWTKKNGPVGGEVREIEVDPATGKVFLLDEFGKSYISTDNGTTWQAITFQSNTYTFNDIEITNGTIFLVGYYDLLASVDGGETFQERMTSVSPYQGANRLKRMPASGNLVVMCYDRSIYVSTNNGQTWTLKSSALAGADTDQLEVNAVDQIFILKNDASFIVRPFRSTDGGVNFTDVSIANGITSGHQVRGLFADNSGSKIYCATITGLYSTTTGTTWTNVKTGSITDPTINDYGDIQESYIEFSADGLGMYFVDNVNHRLHSKTLAEANWTLQSDAFPSGTLSAMCGSAKNYLSATTSTAFFGSQSGVFKTTTGGASVSESNIGIANVKGEQILADNEGNLFLKTNSLGLLKSVDGGNNWSKVTALTGNISSVFASATGDALYALVLNTLHRSYDNGSSWPALTTPGFSWAADVGGDKMFGLQNGTTFYYSSNKGSTWSTAVAVTGLPSSFVIMQDRLAFASANRLILALYDYNVAAPGYYFYRIDFTYNASAVITSAAATKITTQPILYDDVDKVLASNGRFFVYNEAAADEVAVSVNGGVSWVKRAVPASRKMFASKNGYLFFADGGTRKIHLTRDDALTFIESTLPSPTDLYSLNDIMLDNSGYAYLAIYRDYVWRTENTIVPPINLTGLEGIGVASRSVALRWVDTNTFERDVVIERSTSGGAYAVAGQIDGYAGCTNSGNRGYFVDTGLQPGTVYTYRVKAKNQAGESAVTSSVVLTTSANCAQTIPDNRSWTAVNSGESGYPIVSPAKTVAIKHMGNGKYEASDLGLGLFSGSAVKGSFYESCGQTFVAALNDLKPNGNSTFVLTNPTTATLKLKWRQCYADETETLTLTLNSLDPAPAKPIYFTCNSCANPVLGYIVSNSSIELSWTSGYYEKTYVIERSLNSASGFSQIGTATYPVTTFRDDGPLTEGTTYYYRIKSRNANLPTALESPYSDVVSVAFKKPNFLVANNEITAYNSSATLASIWADFNNDGHEDYLTMQFDAASEIASPIIFKNTGASNFEKIIPVLENAQYFWPSVVDFDNDKFPDLALNGQDSKLFDIYKGNGDFTFTKLASAQLGDLATIEKEVSASSWADINKDGLLDLMLLNSDDGSFNIYKQTATHTFTKVETTNVSAQEGAISTLWADYDNDGFPDFLINNLEGQARLYRNNGDETFTLVADNGMTAHNFFGAAWGDYNNDGNIDLFCGNSSKNALYKNNGDGTFTEDISTLISEANFTSSATWADVNNDGYLDLITAGFVSSQTRIFLRDPSVTGTVAFTKIINEKINDMSASHYSVAHADYDKNGLLDIAMSAFKFDDANNDQIGSINNNFYQNNNLPRNWSEVKLTAINGNKEGIGAVVTLTSGGQTQHRQFFSATSLASKNSNIAHFGIGASTTITNIRVKWTNGTIQDYPDPPVNQVLEIFEDLNGPVVTFTPPATVSKGANLSLNITATDLNTVSNVKVFARKITGGTPTSIAAVRGSGDSWNALVNPTDHIDAIGTEYYLEATDNSGNKSRKPTGTDTYKTYVTYAAADAIIPTERLGFGGQVANWKIFAIPFELGANNAIDKVFNELSALKNKVDYRIITYKDTEAWLEYPSGLTNIQRGKGYFINIKSQLANIDVGDNLTAPANSRTSLFKLNLLQGWNMVGNPYLTQISWQDVATYNGISSEILKYSGSGYSVQTQTLDPYEGGFVFMANPLPDVTIPFSGQTTSGGRTKNFTSLGTDINEEKWGLRMKLQQGEFTYELGAIGMAPDANASFDPYDNITPPRFINFLEINFSHPEFFAEHFTRDVVPTQNKFNWEFTVDANGEGRAELTWDNTLLSTGPKELFLLDVERQSLVNMKQSGSFTFDPKESSRFRIYYGESLNITPEKVSLGKAYPNPTNSRTVVGFSLPESGGLNQRVKLDLVDVTGKSVALISQSRLNPGYHEVTFDAKELNTGFYTYRLTVQSGKGLTTEINKLIIK